MIRIRSQSLQKAIPVIMLFSGFAVGGMVPEYARFVGEMGSQFAQPDMATDYAIGLIWAIAIAISIAFWPVSRVERRDLMRLWMIRCFVTMGFMLFYEYNYGLDAQYYYYESLRATYDFSQIQMGGSVYFISCVVWLMNHTLPTFDSYHALKVISSLIGFLGVYVLYRGCVYYTGKPLRNLLYYLMLWPSVLFWSSILGKDPIHWFGIAIYVYGVLCFMKSRRFRYFIPMTLGLALNLLLRPWSAVIFLAPFGLISIWRVRNPIAKLVLLVVFGWAVQFTTQRFLLHIDAENLEAIVRRTNAISHAWSRGGSAQIAPQFTTVWSMLKFAPLGMFTALFRPLPGDVMNPFGILASIENIILLSLLIVAIRRGALRVLRDPMALWATSLLLLWSLFYGFVSYQNLGAAVRFRLQVMPILITLVLFLYAAGTREHSSVTQEIHVRDSGPT
jgi:hypothetical protein